MESAILALEDGTVFEGRSFGACAERSGEVVFNTALTGYQEIFTDPSYSGQIVVLTTPQIGNYGTSTEDNESAKPYIEGLVVREFSGVTSNWRSDEGARPFLEKHGIPVVSDLDTRALVRHLRSRGAMRAVLSSLESSAAVLVERARAIPSMAGLDLASRVSCSLALYMGQEYRAVFALRSDRRLKPPTASCGGLRLRHQAEYSSPSCLFRLPRDSRARNDFR